MILVYESMYSKVIMNFIIICICKTKELLNCGNLKVRTDPTHFVKIIPYMSTCKQTHNRNQAVMRKIIAYSYLKTIFFFLPLGDRFILYIQLQSL